MAFDRRAYRRGVEVAVVDRSAEIREAYTTFAAKRHAVVEPIGESYKFSQVNQASLVINPIPQQTGFESITK